MSSPAWELPELPDLLQIDHNTLGLESSLLDDLADDDATDDVPLQLNPDFLCSSPFASVPLAPHEAGTANDSLPRSSVSRKGADRTPAGAPPTSLSPTSVLLPSDSRQTQQPRAAGGAASDLLTWQLPSSLKSKESDPSGAFNPALSSPAAAPWSPSGCDPTNSFNNLLGCTRLACSSGSAPISAGNYMGQDPGGAPSAPDEHSDKKRSRTSSASGPGGVQTHARAESSLPSREPSPPHHRATQQKSRQGAGSQDTCTVAPAPATGARVSTQQAQQAGGASAQQQRTMLLLRYRQLSLLLEQQEQAQRAGRQKQQVGRAPGGARLGRSISLDPVPARGFEYQIPASDPGASSQHDIPRDGVSPTYNPQLMQHDGSGPSSECLAGGKLLQAVGTPAMSPRVAKCGMRQQAQRLGLGQLESLSWPSRHSSKPAQVGKELGGEWAATENGCKLMGTARGSKPDPMLRRSVTADGTAIAHHAAHAMSLALRTSRSGGVSGAAALPVLQPRSAAASGRLCSRPVPSIPAQADRYYFQPQQDGGEPPSPGVQGRKRKSSSRMEQVEAENAGLRCEVKRLRTILHTWASQGFVTQDQALDFLAGRPESGHQSSMEETTLHLSC